MTGEFGKTREDEPIVLVNPGPGTIVGFNSDPQNTLKSDRAAKSKSSSYDQHTPSASNPLESFSNVLQVLSTLDAREEELKRARDEAECQARTLKILNGISREITALLNTDDLLFRISELLHQIVEYQTFSVLLLDKSRNNLKYRFSISGSTVLTKPDIPLDEGLVGLAARTRSPVLVGDVRSDSRYIKFHEQTRSELVVPLIVKERLIGVLDLENTVLHYFTNAHVQAITILAAQLSVALDNSMLYEQIKDQERKLNDDLVFARRMQRRLLPDDLPLMRRAAFSTLSWPARIIGGDIFDFDYYHRSALHLGMLGDVTGKGAPAALYAAFTSGIIRVLSGAELNPSALLKSVNQGLLERPLEAHFVALLLMSWDDERRILRLANSGLPRPVRWTKNGMEILDVVGTPLGLLPNLEFDDLTVEAEPNDVFVFVTDGILEARNSEGEEFGYERLEAALDCARTLTADEIRDRIATSLQNHMEGAESFDDQTLIVLKVQDVGEKAFRQPPESLRVRTGELTSGERTRPFQF